MKLAVSMWSYVHAWKDGRVDIPGFVREAKRVGAEGVELLDFFYGTTDPDKISELRKATKEALAETGLPVPIFSVAQNFAQRDSAARALQLDKIRFGLDEANEYGAGVVRVFAGDVSEGITYDEARAWIVEGLVEASRLAEKQGLKLALENHGRLAGRGDQVRGLIEDVRRISGVNSLGANPDTGNFMLVEQASHEAIREVAEFANMVHFKDFAAAPDGHEGFAYESLTGKKFVGTAIGEGEVDLAACVKELQSAGFDGWLSIEYEGEEDPFTAIPRSVKNAHSFL